MKILNGKSRNLLLSFLSIIFSIACLAQAHKAPVKAHVKAKPKIEAPIKGDNSLLFEISGNRLTQPSWLFGTMHILCAGDALLSEGLKRSIHSSDQVFFEVDMSDVGAMMNALQYFKMNDNLKLSDLLTPIEYERLKAYFDKNKPPIPLSMMNRFKPMFVSAMIDEQMLDCAKKISMEQLILDQAKKDQKKIDGLETLQFQASLFDSIPYDKQAKELMTYVDSIDVYKETMKDVETQYRKQNIAGLDSLLQKSDPASAGYLDLLLYQRNRRWYDQVAEQIYQHPTLFAVGAGHLGGEQGLISLLRQHGFTIKAIRN